MRDHRKWTKMSPMQQPIHGGFNRGKVTPARWLVSLLKIGFGIVVGIVCWLNVSFLLRGIQPPHGEFVGAKKSMASTKELSATATERKKRTLVMGHDEHNVPEGSGSVLGAIASGSVGQVSRVDTDADAGETATLAKTDSLRISGGSGSNNFASQVAQLEKSKNPGGIVADNHAVAAAASHGVDSSDETRRAPHGIHIMREDSDTDEVEDPRRIIGSTYRFLSDDGPSGIGTKSPDPEDPPCSLTSIFFDPRLPIFDRTDNAYKAMESVAHHAPHDSCFVLQTSTCILERRGDYGKGNPINGNDETTTSGGRQDDAFRTVGDLIYSKAGPRLRDMVHRGRVRMSIIDATKYHIVGCDNFGNGAHPNVFVSAKYLVDEFIHGVDSDLMLFMQRDTFLCRPLDVRLGWNQFAYVGYPFKPNKDGFGPVKRIWRQRRFTYTIPALDGAKQWEIEPWRRYWTEHGDYVDDAIRNHEKFPLPPPTADMGFPTIFPPQFISNKNGFIGNGGLSLRSRKWMLRAIHVCPFTNFSDVDLDVLDINVDRNRDDNDPPGRHRSRSFCRVDMDMMDDLFYSALLPVIGAPMPTSFEAALFVLGGQAFWDWVTPSNETVVNSTILRLRGEEGLIDHHLTKKRFGNATAIGYHHCMMSGECPKRAACEHTFHPS